MYGGGQSRPEVGRTGYDITEPKLKHSYKAPPSPLTELMKRYVTMLF